MWQLCTSEALTAQTHVIPETYFFSLVPGSEHFEALDQLLARHSSTSHYMHWLLLHKLSRVKEAKANGCGSHRHSCCSWAEQRDLFGNKDTAPGMV